MEKHTPGPWYEAKMGDTQGLVIDEQTGANVAAVYDKANARLIAAAPELLEACHLGLAILRNVREFSPETWCRIRPNNQYDFIVESVCKATGQKP